MTQNSNFIDKITEVRYTKDELERMLSEDISA